MSDNNFAEEAFERFLMSPMGQMKLARQAESQLERFGRQQMGNAAKGSKFLNAEDTRLDAEYKTALADGDMDTVGRIQMRYGQKAMDARNTAKQDDEIESLKAEIRTLQGKPDKSEMTLEKLFTKIMEIEQKIENSK